MEYYLEGESIECEASHIIAKKIKPGIALHHEVLGKCVKYNCTRDGIATIREELVPKESKFGNANARLNLSDSLKAKTIHVLVQGFKPIKIEKTAFSGQHNANQFNSDNYTFAQISVPINTTVETFQIADFGNPLNMLSKKKPKQLD